MSHNLLRNIGNVFRRPDGVETFDKPTGSPGATDPHGTTFPNTATSPGGQGGGVGGMASSFADGVSSFASSLLPSKRHHNHHRGDEEAATSHAMTLDSGMSAVFGLSDGLGAGITESPDLYYEDRPLGISIHSLEQIRLALKQLTACANHHALHLGTFASAQRSLGYALVDAMQPPPSSGVGDDGGAGNAAGAHASATDLTDLAVTSVRTDAAHDGLVPPHFSAFLPEDAAEAQTTLGKSLTLLSEVSTKLSTAICTPINDLTSSFEDRYTRKIIPLRKRYIDQKGQYLKYKRNADMADTDEKRSYYEALAEAAKPVWLRTSTELRTEADVMTELTAKNMAQWSRTIALQHERAFAISAANMAEAFTMAKELPSLVKPKPTN